MWHGRALLSYISAAFWPPLSEAEPILRNALTRYGRRTAEAAFPADFVVISGEWLPPRTILI